METIRVGNINVVPIFDAIAVLEPAMFTLPDGSASDWGPHNHLLTDNRQMRIPVGAFLVHTAGRTILFDAGVGETDDPMFEGSALLDNFAVAGVDPCDIDTIVISHLHSDHMGWLEQNDKVTFPNATIRVGAADWDHFAVKGLGGRRRARRLAVVESRVELIERDGEVIAPGITTRATPGHTPGHTSSVISSNGERLIVLGDALHCPAQLTETEWQFLYDADKELASRTRADLLREADEPNTALLPCHFPGMTATRLVGANGTKQWQYA